jgi:hypothetical protein
MERFISGGTIGTESSMTKARRMTTELLSTEPGRAAFGLLVRRLMDVSIEIDRAVAQVDLRLVSSAYDPSHTRRLQKVLHEQGASEIGIFDEGSEAVQTLKSRIRALASEEPVLLVAHLYARATRDPLGAGAIGTLGKAFLQPDGEPTAPVLDPFDDFFNAIDALPLASPVRRRLYDEGIRAQALNLRLARELFNQLMVI